MNKRSTIVEVGRRTRTRNYEVQRLFETLVEVWSEALARGEKIEIENFLILESLRVAFPAACGVT